jgi:hypothetical protein
MLRRTSDNHNDDQPQSTPLWLPSAIPARVPCDYHLYSIEWDFRLAQANDALCELRQTLQLRSHLYKYKDRFVVGQQANTRANASISRAQRHIDVAVTRYRVSRQALVSLAARLKKEDSWKTSLLELCDEDVRGMTVGEDGETEGRRSLSWIWKCGGGGDNSTDDENLHECMFSISHALSLLANLTKPST